MSVRARAPPPLPCFSDTPLHCALCCRSTAGTRSHIRTRRSKIRSRDNTTRSGKACNKRIRSRIRNAARDRWRNVCSGNTRSSRKDDSRTTGGTVHSSPLKRTGGVGGHAGTHKDSRTSTARSRCSPSKDRNTNCRTTGRATHRTCRIPSRHRRLQIPRTSRSCSTNTARRRRPGTRFPRVRSRGLSALVWPRCPPWMILSQSFA